MKKSRVVLVSPIGEIGGAEQVFLKLAQLLPNFGVEPVFACLRPGPLAEHTRQLGIETYVFQEHRMRELTMVGRGIRWLAKVIRQANADLVHANYTAHLYAAPAARLAKVPEVWHIHDYPHTLDTMTRLQMRLPSDHIIFTTDRVASGYPLLGSRRHTIVAPICVDPAALRALPLVPEIREKYHLPNGPLFLTVARLQKHKGHCFLLAAVPAVLAHFPNAVFAIAGKAGNAEQQAYQQELVNQCAALGISKQVIFLGYVSDADLVSLFREATALVHPALTEGFGLTLLEAMALRVPVIAAASDGPKELIMHQKNGLLVPTKDSASLAEAIVQIAGSGALSTHLKQGGEAFVMQKNVQHMAEQTVKIYNAEIHKQTAQRSGNT